MITDHIMASIADLAQEVSQYFVSLQWERLGAMLSYNPSEPLLFSSGLFLFLFLIVLIAANGARAGLVLSSTDTYRAATHQRLLRFDDIR